ncbi:CENPB DNA-binding domain-containing protein 1 [Portunus trituberculatus]|uniref:CENPB DNA-binding domain-containing protein 1 n=1 Tax=Portunus trituberculatus TaxID=210409 RepID=A0A5B7FGW7_PORTR|nr:CENPB DNA-binding domain-containing protein 1 [Portunus trituberculatus]
MKWESFFYLIAHSTTVMRVMVPSSAPATTHSSTVVVTMVTLIPVITMIVVSAVPMITVVSWVVSMVTVVTSARLSWTKRAPLTPLPFPTLSSKQKQGTALARHLTLNTPPKRPATSPVMSPSIVKTRKSLTLEVKLDIIHRHKRGEKTNSIARHHSLTPSTVSTIFKSPDSIKKAGETISSLQAKRTT